MPMHVMLMVSPVSDDVVSPPTISTPWFRHASLMPSYSCSMSSTLKRLLMPRLTTIWVGVPFMA